MTDSDLKLAREIVAKAMDDYGLTANWPSSVREGFRDDLPEVKVALAAIKAGRAAGVAQERERCAWQSIETAPKDRPILTWCDHEADPYNHPGDDRKLTLYASHAEGFSHAPTGFHIVEWGGSFDDSTYEYSGAWLPDWWFVHGSEFEVAANPILWMDLPPVAAAIRKGGEHE